MQKINKKKLVPELGHFTVFSIIPPKIFFNFYFNIKETKSSPDFDTSLEGVLYWLSLVFDLTGVLGGINTIS
jgi:hypothetical protein